MIKRLENGNLNDHSFHGHYFMATKEDVEKVCGPVMYNDNDNSEVVQNEWEMATEDGATFTIYDYKEFRSYEDYEKIEWHIGTENRFGSKKAYEAMCRAFHLHPKITYNI